MKESEIKERVGTIYKLEDEIRLLRHRIDKQTDVE